MPLIHGASVDQVINVVNLIEVEAADAANLARASEGAAQGATTAARAATANAATAAATANAATANAATAAATANAANTNANTATNAANAATAAVGSKASKKLVWTIGSVLAALMLLAIILHFADKTDMDGYATTADLNTMKNETATEVVRINSDIKKAQATADGAATTANGLAAAVEKAQKTADGVKATADALKTDVAKINGDMYDAKTGKLKLATRAQHLSLADRVRKNEDAAATEDLLTESVINTLRRQVVALENRGGNTSDFTVVVNPIGEAPQVLNQPR